MKVTQGRDPCFKSNKFEAIYMLNSLGEAYLGDCGEDTGRGRTQKHRGRRKRGPFETEMICKGNTNENEMRCQNTGGRMLAVWCRVGGRPERMRARERKCLDGQLESHRRAGTTHRSRYFHGVGRCKSQRSDSSVASRGASKTNPEGNE